MNSLDDLAPDSRDDPTVESRTDPAAERLAEGFAQHVERWARRLGCDEKHLPVLRLAAYETSVATSNGNVCILLSDVTGLNRESLLASGLVGTPESPAACPLILDPDDRLYLHRYFDYERRLARRLMQAATAPPRPVSASARDLLQTLFPPSAATEVDWQKIAAAMALRNGLTVISGGPGTGKTTTVVNLIACLITQDPHSRIALAAPTGKAAARMTEAIRQRAEHLPAALREKLPSESFTIHRLLGANPGLGKFTHHAGNPLPIDALIVDEASMLDLALATRLLEAVPASARIILLGDKDQLSAVESGAVFAELCADPTLSEACRRDVAEMCGYAPERIVAPAPVRSTALRDAAVWLTKSYRFGADSGIDRLARYVNEGRADEAIAWLRGTPLQSAVISAAPPPAISAPGGRKKGKGAEQESASLPLFPELVEAKRSAPDPDTSVQWLEPGPESTNPIAAVIAGYAPYFSAVLADPHDVDAITRAFASFRALCAVRQGPSGVTAINDKLTRHARHGAGGGSGRAGTRQPLALVRRPPGDGPAQRLRAQAFQRRHRHRAAGRQWRTRGVLPRRRERLPSPCRLCECPNTRRLSR